MRTHLKLVPGNRGAVVAQDVSDLHFDRGRIAHRLLEELHFVQLERGDRNLQIAPLQWNFRVNLVRNHHQIFPLAAAGQRRIAGGGNNALLLVLNHFARHFDDALVLVLELGHPEHHVGSVRIISRYVDYFEGITIAGRVAPDGHGVADVVRTGLQRRVDRRHKAAEALLHRVEAGIEIVRDIRKRLRCVLSQRLRIGRVLHEVQREARRDFANRRTGAVRYYFPFLLHR